MRIQNCQSYQNNQPRFKANTLVKLESLKGAIGTTKDIYADVAKKANIGAEASQVVRRAQGYVVPDASTTKGAELATKASNLRNAKNIPARDYSAQAVEVDRLAEEMSNDAATVVI